MAVLYRKYRPQTFAEVLNQKPIIQTLKNQIQSGSISHAYLFTGSRGVGKTSIARILAKAVNCIGSSRQQGDACGECEICKQIEASSFLDLVEIDAASNTGVDNIRDLIEHVKFSPSMGKYKVFIIDEVHMLSKGAFNALLKTLEEPPAHAIFILATTEINKVPATIVSRTQRFDFKALPAQDLQDHLLEIVKKEKSKISPEILSLVAQNSQGSVRDALSLLDKVLTLGDDATIEQAQALLGVTDLAWCIELLKYIVTQQPQDIPEFFERLEEKGLDLAIFNRDFLNFLRTALISKITGQNASSEVGILEKVESMSVNDIIFVIRLFLKSYKDLASAPSPDLPLLIASIEAASKKAPKAALPSSQPSFKESPAPTVSFKTQEQPAEKPSVEVVEFVRPIGVVTITFSEISPLWPQVINKVKPINSPLASILKNSNLIRLENGVIVIGVKFLFDKQSLHQAKSLKIISETLREIYGQPLALAAEVIKAEHEEAPALGLGDALKVFGGELID